MPKIRPFGNGQKLIFFFLILNFTHYIYIIPFSPIFYKISTTFSPTLFYYFIKKPPLSPIFLQTCIHTDPRLVAPQDPRTRTQPNRKPRTTYKTWTRAF
ncbi:hypothetical protein HanHA300_Chr13g0481951 [Helianthus annuus]|nr:hypothetical protein HanHA300_Chr13g0481951 [Helianthus annuus]